MHQRPQVVAVLRPRAHQLARGDVVRVNERHVEPAEAAVSGDARLPTDWRRRIVELTVADAPLQLTTQYQRSRATKDEPFQTAVTRAQSPEPSVDDDGLRGLHQPLVHQQERHAARVVAAARPELGSYGRV